MSQRGTRPFSAGEPPEVIATEADADDLVNMGVRDSPSVSKKKKRPGKKMRSGLNVDPNEVDRNYGLFPYL